MIRRIGAGLLALLACVSLMAGGESPASHPATAASPLAIPVDLKKELEQLEGKLADLQDLTTHFTQEKHTPLLRKPLVSSGIIRVRQDLMRWDTQKPIPSSMLIGKNEIRLYYPNQKVMEIYPLDQQLARLAASPVPQIAIMQEHFNFARGSAGEFDKQATDRECLAVVLTPRQEMLKQHIDQIRLLIDRNSGYLRQMEMIDADGDRTVIRFDTVKMNTGVTEKEMELLPPTGTRISRPLSGEGISN